jgi:large subunit ribosomal protein L15
LTAINVAALNRFPDGTTVDTEQLLESGVLSKCEYGVKILGNGTLTSKLTVRVAAFSKSAKQKIEDAGGKAEVV